MSHIWMSHVTHMNESCHTYEWVMSHIRMSHVTHMNESCHAYEWVMTDMQYDPVSRVMDPIDLYIYIYMYIYICIYVYKLSHVHATWHIFHVRYAWVMTHESWLMSHDSWVMTTGASFAEHIFHVRYADMLTCGRVLSHMNESCQICVSRVWPLLTSHGPYIFVYIYTCTYIYIYIFVYIYINYFVCTWHGTFLFLVKR